MATVTRGLPDQPHLDVPKREARELLDDVKAQRPEALERVRARHPNPEKVAAGAFKLADALLVIAREYTFSSWPELKFRIERNDIAGELMQAMLADDRQTVVRLLRANPALLHIPLKNGKSGPPLTHAANLGRLELVQAIAALGARDFQRAFDRAVLRGRIDCARWLHPHGITLKPGIIMGSCETLSIDGFNFLVELGAPVMDARGDRLAPLAFVLEIYARHPAGKHALLDRFSQLGYHLPDTPIMAFHRGDVAALERHRRREPDLLSRRFALSEIYPAECGCRHGGRTAACWTPIAGTTLLHLSVDFREQEIFDWLLAQGAEVNARAAIDAAGIGGHTALFHTVVNGPGHHAKALLARGADPKLRASLRKFIDWCETPGWHEARNVTALEWARTFPDPSWVDQDGVRTLEAL